MPGPIDKQRQNAAENKQQNGKESPNHEENETQPSHEMQVRITSMFDSYAKTVLKNTSRNIKRKIANRGKREIIVEDANQCLTSSTYNDTYSSSQYLLYSDDAKFSCIVYSETLYLALLALTDRQRTLLMLDFWYGWLDKDIATYMEVTTRTVYNLRQRAYLTIRSFYEKGKEEN